MQTDTANNSKAIFCHVEGIWDSDGIDATSPDGLNVEGNNAYMIIAEKALRIPCINFEMKYPLKLILCFWHIDIIWKWTEKPDHPIINAVMPMPITLYPMEEDAFTPPESSINPYNKALAPAGNCNISKQCPKHPIIDEKKTT